MTSTLNSLTAIAASGTLTVIVPFPNPAQGVQVQLNAEYAAVDTTSGVSAVVTISHDGGSNYVASNTPMAEVAPAATKVGSSLAQFMAASSDAATAKDAGNLTHVKLVLTNTDAVNEAVVAVLSETIH